jgi:hypothetical protein
MYTRTSSKFTSWFNWSIFKECWITDRAKEGGTCRLKNVSELGQLICVLSLAQPVAYSDLTTDPATGVWLPAGAGNRPAMEPIQALIQLVLSPEVKRLGLEADYSAASSAQFKQSRSCTSTSLHILMAWCLIKHRDRFTCRSLWYNCNAIVSALYFVLQLKQAYVRYLNSLLMYRNFLVFNKLKMYTRRVLWSLDIIYNIVFVG